MFSRLLFGESSIISTLLQDYESNIFIGITHNAPLNKIAGMRVLAISYRDILLHLKMKAYTINAVYVECSQEVNKF